MLFDLRNELSGISRVISITSTSQKLTADIDAVDSYGFDRFSLSSSHSLHMSFSRISSNAELQLLSRSAQVLHSATNGRTSDETVDQILDAGIDYNQHDPDGVASRAYNLYVSAIASVQAPNTSKSSSDGDILTNFAQQNHPDNTSTLVTSNSVGDRQDSEDKVDRQDNEKNENASSLIATTDQTVSGDASASAITTDQNSSIGQTVPGETSSAATTTEETATRNASPSVVTTDQNSSIDQTVSLDASAAAITFEETASGDVSDSAIATDQNSSIGQTVSGETSSAATIEETASGDASPSAIATDQNSSIDQTASGSNNLTNETVLSESETVPILNAVNSVPIFTNFSVIDASGDNTLDTVLEGGAIKFSYDLADSESVSSVKLEVVKFDSIVDSLGTWNQSKISNNLINLANFSSIAAGEYLVRAIANTIDGQEILSSFQPLRILPWNQNLGTFTADTLNYSNLVPEEAAVFLGRGGTDTLNLEGIDRADVTSINGINLSAFDPLSNSTANQAIFQGTAFDYLTLADGGEIYFQGIETLKFADGSNLELQVRPNDANFSIQWNLHVSDVDSAWRFTQGTNNILLVSLDTGILTAPGASGSIFDLAGNRLITDPTDDDNQDDDRDPTNGTTTYGHGHSSISIMSSIANNNSGVAGINWNSQVYVTDVYGGVSLQQAIGNAIDYARANNMRVVFQTGIQGDYWLDYNGYSGGTREQLEQLIQNNSDIALFAVGAGNGGASGNYQDPNYLTSVNGLARLETTHSNVMSVGALETQADVSGLPQWQYELVNGLMNAKVANIAPYSNRGSNLTLMAATDSPAVDKYGNVNYFGGTSAANPNLAGIASLVWSVNPNLNASQVRQILTDTAMDLGVADRDNTFGYGLVNADAAVRRAWALQNNSELANLYQGNSLLV